MQPSDNQRESIPSAIQQSAITTNNNSINNANSRNGHDGHNDVIVIESDAEEDAIDKNRNVPWSQPRDEFHRFARIYDNINERNNHSSLSATLDRGNTPTTSIPRGTLPTQTFEVGHHNNAPDNNADDDDDDDIIITNEIIAPVDPSGPLNPSTEYVDLDNEAEYSSNNNYGHSRTLIVDGDNDNADVIDDGNGADDLVIVQERTSAPTVTLTLPGNRSIQINAAPTDRPVRSSFGWQGGVPDSRRGMLARRYNSVRQLFFNSDEDASRNGSDSDSYDDDYTPARLQRIQNRERNAVRQRMMQQRRQQQILRQEQSRNESPIMAELRRRINAYPPDVRSIFDHATTLNEFLALMQSTAPITLEDNRTDLIDIFTLYRGNLTQNWMINRMNSSRDNSARTASSTPMRNMPAHTRFVQGFLHSIMGLGGDFPYGGTESDEEATTQNIIRMIEEREANERDSKVKQLMKKTKKQQEDFENKAKYLPKGFSASFSLVPKKIISIDGDDSKREIVTDEFLAEEYEELPVCCLCGVELGVGIPDSFRGITPEESKVSFDSLVKKYNIPCPYNALSAPGDIDRDLSRRTYVASCGHSFCGRCVRRINHAKESGKISKQKLKELVGPENPDIYGPKTCPATDCTGKLRRKGQMREVYF